MANLKFFIDDYVKKSISDTQSITDEYFIVNPSIIFIGGLAIRKMIKFIFYLVRILIEVSACK